MTDDRIALVTGASSGIGRTIALHLGRKGLKVALLARRKSRLDGVEREIRRQGGEAICIAADISVSRQVEKAVQTVVETWGRIDVLVNNAGIGEAGPVDEVTDDSIHRQFAVNVFGPFYATRAVVPHMRRQGGGQIVNIGSVVGMVGLKNMSVYAATKWALRGLNESWREELFVHNIKVAYVAPGYVITAFGGRREDHDVPEAEWALRPEDVAHVVENIIDQGPNSDIKEVVIQVLDRS